MEQQACKTDQLGREFGKKYSLIITEPYFENRLKAFDKNLRLMFDQGKRRWVVLEWARDHSGWNVIMTCEDEETKEPKALGEWVFNRLFVYRERYNEKAKNPDAFLNGLDYEAQREAARIERRASQDLQHKLIDDISFWRKLARNWRHLPKIDPRKTSEDDVRKLILKEENPYHEGF